MTTILSLKTNSAVFLAADKQTTMGNLKLPITQTKIQQLGHTALISGTGSVGAIQQIVQIAFKDILMNRIYNNNLDFDVGAGEMSQRLAELNFNLPLEFKQFESFAFILAGYNEHGGQIYSVDCSGAVIPVETFYADGSGHQLALSLLEEHYKPDMENQEVANLLFNIMKQVGQREIYTSQDLDCYIIDEKGIRTFEIKPTEEKETTEYIEERETTEEKEETEDKETNEVEEKVLHPKEPQQ